MGTYVFAAQVNACTANLLSVALFDIKIHNLLTVIFYTNKLLTVKCYKESRNLLTCQAGNTKTIIYKSQNLLLLYQKLQCANMAMQRISYIKVTIY